MAFRSFKASPIKLKKSGDLDSRNMNLLCYSLVILDRLISSCHFRLGLFFLFTRWLLCNRFPFHFFHDL